MSPDSKILEKVRKLLSLSHGTPNPAEAETAMALAQKLLLEHDLSMLEVGTDTDREFAEEVLGTAGPGARLTDDVSFAWGIVQMFFFCHPLLISDPIDGSQELHLIGRREHLPIGRYVGVFLSRTFRALWAAERRRSGLRACDGRAYYCGLHLGVSERLDEERKRSIHAHGGTAALIRAHDAALAGELARRYPYLQPARQRHIRDSDGVLRAGYERGKQIQIRDPLPGPAPTSAVKRISVGG